MQRNDECSRKLNYVDEGDWIKKGPVVEMKLLERRLEMNEERERKRKRKRERERR